MFCYAAVWVLLLLMLINSTAYVHKRINKKHLHSRCHILNPAPGITLSWFHVLNPAPGITLLVSRSKFSSWCHVLLVSRSESSRQMAVKPAMFWVTRYPSIGPQKLKMSLVCCLTAWIYFSWTWGYLILELHRTEAHRAALICQVALVLGPHPAAYQLLYENWYRLDYRAAVHPHLSDMGIKKVLIAHECFGIQIVRRKATRWATNCQGLLMVLNTAAEHCVNSSTFAQWSYVYQACRKGSRNLVRLNYWVQSQKVWNHDLKRIQRDRERQEPLVQVYCVSGEISRMHYSRLLIVSGCFKVLWLIP